MKNYLFSNYTHIEYNALKYIPAVVQKKGKLPPTRFPQVRQLVREAPETIELLDSSAEPAAKADLQRVGSGMFDVCGADSAEEVTAAGGDVSSFLRALG